MIHNAALVSTAEWSDSVIQIHTFFFVFFSILVYHRILNLVACAIQEDLVVYPPHARQFASANPQLPVRPFPSPSLLLAPLANTRLFSMWVCFCFPGKFICVTFYIHTQVIASGICLSLSDFTWYDNLQVQPCCYKWHYFIPLYGWVVFLYISSVQLLSHVWLFVTPWTAAHQASLSFTNSRGLHLMSIVSVMPSNHLILCHPLFLLPSIFPSIRVLSNESVLHIGWPNVWATGSVLPMNTRTDLPQDGLVGSPCSPRDSQESSTPQFRSIISLVLSYFYGPTLTSIHDC